MAFAAYVLWNFSYVAAPLREISSLACDFPHCTHQSNTDSRRRARILVPLLANRGLYALVPNGHMARRFFMASAGFTIGIVEGAMG